MISKPEKAGLAVVDEMDDMDEHALSQKGVEALRWMHSFR